MERRIWQILTKHTFKKCNDVVILLAFYDPLLRRTNNFDIRPSPKIKNKGKPTAMSRFIHIVLSFGTKKIKAKKIYKTENPKKYKILNPIILVTMKSLPSRSMSSSSEHSMHSSCSSSCDTCVSKDRPSRKSSSSHHAPADNTYNRIKVGLRRSNPAAIVLWAFHKMPSRQGLTSRRVIGFLKKHYKVIDDPHRTGKSIGSMLRCAVDFGLLEKRGNKYFLVPKKR